MIPRLRCMLLLPCTLLVLSSVAVAQTSEQTAWGHPDLQGIWDFRTITPLGRCPRG